MVRLPRLEIVRRPANADEPILDDAGRAMRRSRGAVAPRPADAACPGTSSVALRRGGGTVAKAAADPAAAPVATRRRGGAANPDAARPGASSVAQSRGGGAAANGATAWPAADPVDDTRRRGGGTAGRPLCEPPAPAEDAHACNAAAAAAADETV